MGDAVKSGIARVETVVRILKHDLDIFPKRRPVKVARRDMADRLSLEHDLALARVDQPADHARGGALAGTGFADQTDALAGVYHHGKVRYRSSALIEALGEFLDLKQRRRTRRGRRSLRNPYRNAPSPFLFRHQVRDAGTRRGRGSHKAPGVGVLRSAEENLRLGL